MELKNYQEKVIERFETYLQVLGEKRRKAEIVFDALKDAGEEPELPNYCKEAWDELNKRRLLPPAWDKRGNAHVAEYGNRFDGLDRAIPNVCLKVPTAGGKTLLATAALERLKVDYFHQQTGFVLWVVPSDAIYKQTWKNLANREHPYRQMLERASGGRVRLLERWDPFKPHDVKGHLCVMLLMLQAAGRQSKETLRMFRDSGRFTEFFPPVDDYSENNALLNEIRNLDTNDLGDGDDGVLKGVSVKHSLGNTLRLIRPIVIIDEGHKAYSETARDTLCGFNPSFVLELSATPNAKRHLSNVLVDIPGTALKEEQMIKLPIVLSDKPTDWKGTLTEAHARLADLQKDANKLQRAEGRYIRPIMLVRVDRTGKDQRDGIHVHAEDAREFLIDNLGVNADETRVKSASVDEIGDEDLLSEFSSVRYIITKDALREGWDCPFAAVLVVLSKTTAITAMTQMIGRVLRQPDATATGIESLNQCYVYCYDQDVSKAIESIKTGLEEEGMGDLAEDVVTDGNGNGSKLLDVTIKRSPAHKGVQILLPRVLHSDGAGKFRLIDYHRDILGKLDWKSFSFARAFDADKDKLEGTVVKLDMEKKDGQFELALSEKITADTPPEELDFPFMVRQLMDVVPNPWQAARIIEEALKKLKGKVSKEKLFANRLALVDTIRRDLQKQIDAASEALFRKKLKSGEITFRLIAPADGKLNWQLVDKLQLKVLDTDKKLKKKNADDLERPLFEAVYERELNNLERNVALHLDGKETVKWWHRMVARQDYHLQGWQRNRVFPDFLISLTDLEDGTKRLAVLETKGEQLKGNDDTDYKNKLFELLTEVHNTGIEAGEFKVVKGHDQRLVFKMLMEDNWSEDLKEAEAALPN